MSLAYVSVFEIYIIISFNLGAESVKKRTIRRKKNMKF